MLRRNAVIAQASRAYTPAFQAEEDKSGFRHAYTLFLPLKNKHELGTAAAVLEETEPKKIESLLSEVRNWGEFPISALSYALQRGVRFPLPDRPMKMEEMDMLAPRLVQENGDIADLLLANSNSPQELAWRKSLALAAILACKWKDGAQHLALAKAFAQIEEQFLKYCYSAEVLCPENLVLLPSMHRFGWYCAQAFEALDSGDVKAYVRHLREGLSTCENMRDMVEFLIKHTPELQNPSQELLELADKVRGMLATFDPDDPAVAAIKASPVYQKVAYLIEGVEAPVIGGLLQ